MITNAQATGTPETRAVSAAASCPNCGHFGMQSFYRADDIPVHSCLLVPTAQEAAEFPRGDLELACCPACGFISNVRYDQAQRHYNPQYEETQGFSRHFNTFLVGLVRRLLERYDLRQKTVVEIGCGKGEFLWLLCQLGNNRGVGIDPSCTPARLPAEAGERVRIIMDYYRPEHGQIAADVICCRHTLEHIPQTREFLQAIRQSIGDRRDVVVFFEVPDTMRVLAEGAFWDVYYEHCSYFTAGSLARLFRQAGFELDELWLDYGDQYVLLTARPTDQPTDPHLAIEDDLRTLPAAVEKFSAQVSSAIRTWRQFILTQFVRRERTVLWGSGSKAVAFLSTLGVTDEVTAVVDINPYRQGKFIPGTAQEIIAPRDLVEIRPDHVIVMNPAYRREIQAELDRLGLRPQVLAV